MLIGNNSKYLLKKTRSKAKMFEYNVPEELHIVVEENANELLLIAIAIIGNVSSEILREDKPYRLVPADKKAELEFSSHYFDAFLHSKLEPHHPQYYLLLGATAYYLCDYIGSAKVMADTIRVDELDLGCGGIEKVLALLLQDRITQNSSFALEENNQCYVFLKKAIEFYCGWFERCEYIDLDFAKEFHNFIYAQGSARELLLTDALLAILLIKKERSALHLLPEYSEQSLESWKGLLQGGKGIHELWPAQIRLGEAGVFSGKSAVIQMPTSSGKTASMSIAIRAAFLAGRTSLAIVVAPFRALCREISIDIEHDFLDDRNVHVNVLSDVLEMDDLKEMLDFTDEGVKNIIVLTPEKLIYLLRQDIALIREAGLIIFDEAHMFDDASRGAQYELLIATIMMYLDENIQRLFLSAVIPNAEQINGWFTQGKGIVIADDSIRTTEKSIAIADWESHNDKRYGYLYFLDPENRNSLEFFVPRIIDVRELNKLKKNEKVRFFPEVDFQKMTVEYNDISIYLALKLNHNGAVAIFCGRKDTASNILKRIVEIGDRGIDISSFEKQVIGSEHEKIAYLIKENYGRDNIFYKAAMKGVFSHHRGISNGIRIATEYAMKEKLIRCIVCTSTLSQGVNLPIRYLIISSLYQAGERIKVRDFHNLIGRTGRAGQYTEGTVILSETFVYSRKNTQKDRWRWNDYLEMMDPSNSESCLSQFLMIVRPQSFQITYETKVTYDFYEMALARYNLEDFEERLDRFISNFKKKYPSKLQSFQNAIEQVIRSLDAIESYLLSFLDDVYDFDQLVSSTFGYFLADEKEKERMKIIFSTIRGYLLEKVTKVSKRAIFSRTLLGTNHLLELEKWVVENSEELNSCETASELLQIITPKIVECSDNQCLKAIITQNEISNLANMWINGMSYKQIHDYADENSVMILRRKKEVAMQLSDIIEMCDNGFGYRSTLIINAISELLRLYCEDCENVYMLLSELSSRMRYGLPTRKSIIIYESGFADRTVSLRLAAELRGSVIKNKRQFYKIARLKKKNLMEALIGLPKVFSDCMDEI